MKVLTPDEAKAEGYSGYAHHLSSVPCPRNSDPKIYCATCSAITELEKGGHHTSIDIRGFKNTFINGDVFKKEK